MTQRMRTEKEQTLFTECSGALQVARDGHGSVTLPWDSNRVFVFGGLTDLVTTDSTEYVLDRRSYLVVVWLPGCAAVNLTYCDCVDFFFIKDH